MDIEIPVYIHRTWTCGVVTSSETRLVIDIPGLPVFTRNRNIFRLFDSNHKKLELASVILSERCLMFHLSSGPWPVEPAYDTPCLKLVGAASAAAEEMGYVVGPYNFGTLHVEI